MPEITRAAVLGLVRRLRPVDFCPDAMEACSKAVGETSVVKGVVHQSVNVQYSYLVVIGLRRCGGLCCKQNEIHAHLLDAINIRARSFEWVLCLYHDGRPCIHVGGVNYGSSAQSATAGDGTASTRTIASGGVTNHRGQCDDAAGAGAKSARVHCCSVRRCWRSAAPQ